nr:C-type lectin domain-containing receptor 4 [Arenicola marina]
MAAIRVIMLVSLVGIHTSAAHTREYPPDGTTAKCLVTEGVSRCYTVKAMNGSWDAARGLCERSYPDVGSLAALNSPDARLFVETFVLPGVPSELVWVGGRRRQDSQGWQWVGGHSYSGDPVRPLADGRGDCGSYRLGNYTATTCDARIATFLCANITLPPAGPVSCNKTSLPTSAGTGVAICRKDTEVTWYEARNFCLGLGGDLARLEAVPSDADLNVNDVSIWIGLHRRPWFWFLENNTEEAVTWTVWGTHEAEAECIAVNVTSAMWMMTSCNRVLSYAICLVSNGFYGNVTPTAGDMATVTDGTNLILIISLCVVLGVLLLTAVVLGVLWGRKHPCRKTDAENCPTTDGGHDSHVAARPSSAVVSPYSVATGAHIMRREGSDGVQRQGSNRLTRLWAAFKRTVESNTAHAPPGVPTRGSSPEDDVAPGYSVVRLPRIDGDARPVVADGTTANGTSGPVAMARPPTRRDVLSYEDVNITATATAHSTLSSDEKSVGTTTRSDPESQQNGYDSACNYASDTSTRSRPA